MGKVPYQPVFFTFKKGTASMKAVKVMKVKNNSLHNRKLDYPKLSLF